MAFALLLKLLHLLLRLLELDLNPYELLLDLCMVGGLVSVIRLLRELDLTDLLLLLLDLALIVVI